MIKNKPEGTAILVILAICMVALEVVVSGKRQAENVPASGSVFAMDTVITLEVYDGQGEEALRSAETLIEKLESLWSVTKEDSEISRANHSQELPIQVGQETEELIAYTLQLANDTGGALNPALYPIVRAWGFTSGEYRIPDEAELEQLLKVGLGAVAKGYAGDLLVDALKEHGVTSGIINQGGNVALVGERPDGTPWRIGIRSAYGEGNIGILEASDCHIVTSGGYERYFIGDNGITYWHILNPFTGSPARSGIVSVAIVGKDGMRCDGLSTVVFVMGLEQAAQYWRAWGNFEMILVTEEHEVYVTEGLEGRFQMNEVNQEIPLHIIMK